MGMHEHVMYKNKLHHKQKPNPNYNTHSSYSVTQPRIHENMIKMLKNAMHEHVITLQQKPTHKFQHKHKALKFQEI